MIGGHRYGNMNSRVESDMPVSSTTSRQHRVIRNATPLGEKTVGKMKRGEYVIINGCLCIVTDCPYPHNTYIGDQRFIIAVNLANGDYYGESTRCQPCEHGDLLTITVNNV